MRKEKTNAENAEFAEDAEKRNARGWLERPALH
jgi:hypothetical protein